MPFKAKHDQITARVTKTDPNQYWVNTLLLSFVLVALVAGYQVLKGNSFNVYQLNIVFALVGMYLIGLSFAMSGLTYFWDFVDTKVVYRKYLGLVGFYYILSHALFSFLNYFFIPTAPLPNFDFDFAWIVGGLRIENTWAFLAGIISLALFAFMAMISNKYSMVELGGVRWRNALRYMGYAAYAIIVIHFGLKRFAGWSNWLQSPNGLPPQSLILLAFVAFVFILRLALFIAVSGKKAAPQAARPPQQPAVPPQQMQQNTQPQGLQPQQQMTSPFERMDTSHQLPEHTQGWSPNQQPAVRQSGPQTPYGQQ